jgi:hypothetical protein
MEKMDDLLTEVQELTWAMVDEQANEQDVSRLERLLLDHDEARQTYMTCMQMHADLHFLFSGKPRLPEALQKAMAADKAKATKKPLPLVDLPMGGFTAAHSNGCR